MVNLVHNVQKKQHRERSQPNERKRWGLLEKKKDYKLRAADYHKKQDALKKLRTKASLRNPDEYYHSMTRKRADDNGVLIASRGNDVLDVDQAKLLKTQDSNYINVMRLKELKKIEKFKDSPLLFMNDTSKLSKHTVFVDNKSDQIKFNPTKYFKTHKSLLNSSNRLTLDQVDNIKNSLNYNDAINNDSSNGILELSNSQIRKLNKKKLKQLKLHRKRIQNEKKLRQVQLTLDLSREVMKNGNKKKLTKNSGNKVFKWKKERKR
ncbi:rRNA-processing protein UTP11 [Ascoidea rubescens DSM 1968]|uniref:U3 small nucleolar RNA-associated protein 11 n=1 Tax=Ascoidea rubescens DSM 1968 TaxID=1344418 RepID=A0A1D2VBX5_9ASCO|nr:U3 small nucleolar RNA-associated protein 11 [Ascoidea rubescens DSM 1968]ODV59136.1 U3 small nucleolar RNA-associated protein 11 [Ascoidea rubescens DSM 1968]